MVVTLESIEKEVADSIIVRSAMNRVMSELNKAVGYYIAKYGEEHGARMCKDVILGKRKLDTYEKQQASKKFGNEVARPLETMSKLNTAQKQYIFKRMGWDITEVE